MIPAGRSFRHRRAPRHGGAWLHLAPSAWPGRRAARMPGAGIHRGACRA
jgi:hypothetical protein